jgi:putative membrane protein
MTQLPPADRTREYLANERTFLAWVRTSIAVISLGFVIAKFSVWMRELVIRLAPGKPIPATGMSMPMGIGMMGFGGVLIILAAWHYHCVNRAIERGEVKANRGLVISVTVAVAALSVATIIYMVLTSEQL